MDNSIAMADTQFTIDLQDTKRMMRSSMVVGTLKVMRNSPIRVTLLDKAPISALVALEMMLRPTILVLVYHLQHKAPQTQRI